MQQNGSITQVAIIGAGFGGLGMGIRLKKEGRDDFIIFERAAEVGGTWRDNVYPGCACDVPSHLYSFSYNLNPNWTKQYSPQPEILKYLKNTTDKFDIRKHIRFNSCITALHFDKEKAFWRIQTSDGQEFLARYIVSATGPLNQQAIPNIKGLQSFKGDMFHSSTWNHDIDLKGKKVAVIGTGASAIQFIPEVAKEAGQLKVFMRTPPWIIPKFDRKISRFEHWLFKTLPFFQKFFRTAIYWRFELGAAGFKQGSWINKLVTVLAKRHIKTSISNRELRAKMTPDYTLGCKRVLISDDFYPTLEKEHVELTTEPITEITEGGVKDQSGETFSADVILLGTGFHASETVINMDIFGREGQNLRDEWKESGPEAYYGLSVSGYPNLFFFLGPNTGLGHNSVVHIIESQVNYVMDYLHLADQNQDSFFDLKKEVQQSFNEDIQERLQSSVWQSGGCKSWYQTSDGKNTILWPGYTVTYRKQTRSVNWEAYEKIKVKQTALV